MQAIVHTVTTFWSQGNELGTIIRGYIGICPFSIVGNFENQVVDCTGISEPAAYALADYLDAAGLAPNHGEAYGIYNGDVDGPDHGCLVDVLNAVVPNDVVGA